MSGAVGRPVLCLPRLRTDRLELTPLHPEADAPDLHVMLADAEVHRYDVDARASTSRQETEWRLSLQVMANGGATWAVRLRGGGTAIGTVGLVGDTGTAVQGVGWSLATAWWGRKLMSEAAAVVIPWLLAQDGVAGLEAWVDARNAASLGVARAAGMTERERLPRVYAESIGQTIVMARGVSAAELDDPGHGPCSAAPRVTAPRVTASPSTSEPQISRHG